MSRIVKFLKFRKRKYNCITVNTSKKERVNLFLSKLVDIYSMTVFRSSSDKHHFYPDLNIHRIIFVKSALYSQSHKCQMVFYFAMYYRCSKNMYPIYYRCYFISN